MGRWGTGAITTKEALRIELSYLLRQGFLKKGFAYGYLSWTNGSNIMIEVHNTKEERFLKLRYCITDNQSGEKENHEDLIQLCTIPSNLGKGEIIYMQCPITGRRARILYKCYGSNIWKSRGAYRNRIYYPSQQCSKNDYHNTRYWALEKELDKCQALSKKKHYQGKETRIRKRIKLLKEQKEYHDWARFAIMANLLQKFKKHNAL